MVNLRFLVPGLLLSVSPFVLGAYLYGWKAMVPLGILVLSVAYLLGTGVLIALGLAEPRGES